MAWDNLQRRYEVRNARIVATVLGGGALIESGNFVYEEGRWPHPGDGPTRPPLLSLSYTFETLDAPDFDAAESVQARIIIDGEGEAGRLEIRGDGWIGYTEHGFLTGYFDRAPDMLLDYVEAADDPEEDTVSESMPERWAKRMELIKPKTSAEYDRATRGREWADLEDEDD
jgi:hypothetical protein